MSLSHVIMPPQVVVKICSPSLRLQVNVRIPAQLFRQTFSRHHLLIFLGSSCKLLRILEVICVSQSNNTMCSIHHDYSTMVDNICFNLQQWFEATIRIVCDSWYCLRLLVLAKYLRWLIMDVSKHGFRNGPYSRVIINNVGITVINHPEHGGLLLLYPH